MRKARGSKVTGPGKVYRKDSSFLTVLFYYISIVFVLVLVSDPGSASPFFRDALLAPVLHLSLWIEEKGSSAGRGLYHERSKEVNLF